MKKSGFKTTKFQYFPFPSKFRGRYSMSLKKDEKIINIVFLSKKLQYKNYYFIDPADKITVKYDEIVKYLYARANENFKSGRTEYYDEELNKTEYKAFLKEGLVIGSEKIPLGEMGLNASPLNFDIKISFIDSTLNNSAQNDSVNFDIIVHAVQKIN